MPIISEQFLCKGSILEVLNEPLALFGCRIKPALYLKYSGPIRVEVYNPATMEPTFQQIEISGFVQIYKTRPDRVTAEFCKFTEIITIGKYDLNQQFNIDIKHYSSDSTYIELSSIFNYLRFHEFENLESTVLQSLLQDKEIIEKFVQLLCRDNETDLTKKEARDTAYSNLFELFGKNGAETFEVLSGSTERATAEPKNLEDEIKLEGELDGRIWYDLESLLKRWKKYDFSKQDLLYHLEMGSLTASFNWRIKNIRSEYHYWFEETNVFDGAVSPLIEFKLKNPFKSESNAFNFHCYEICASHGNIEYQRLLNIHRSSASQLRSSSYIQRPFCGVNGMALIYRSKSWFNNERESSPVVINEDELLFTSREIRRFEREEFGKKLESYLVSNDLIKKITIAEDSSHLKVIAALLKLLTKERLRPYTQDLIQNELEKLYRDELKIKSFSKSNLQKIFSKANSALKDG
ncbi:MAG: hypothetical protein Alis3KO_26270 [Aliiglaciecola sp.]